MLKAIIINNDGEVVFTHGELKDNERFVTYEELIDYSCIGYEIPEDMVLVKEGIVFTDDMNLVLDDNALSIIT